MSNENNSFRKKRKSEMGSESSIGCSSTGNVDLENIGLSCRRKQRKRNSVDEKKVTSATILAWLLDVGMIQQNEEVYTIDETSKLIKKRGMATRDGILCSCCRGVFSATNFHIHGGGSCSKPYETIFLNRTNVSLLCCMTQAWNKPEECRKHVFNTIESEIDEYDDTCMICADGGNLMCCEKCSSTYHQGCLNLEDVPEGSWYCPYCVCKICGEQSSKDDDLLTCPQCEKGYHWKCHLMNGPGLDLNITSLAPFCDHDCKEVFDKLSNSIVGTRYELDEGYSWTLLRRMGDKDDAYGIYINDNYSRVLCHSKLVVARRVMEECFETIQDRHTRVNVVPSVVYNCGSNFKRVDFKGFYTAVLEKDDEIITVASLRIHGKRLAELPFIATNEAHRRKGMCKLLMVAIESVLGNLGIKDLIIPSVPRRAKTWIGGYNFCRLETTMKNEIMKYSTLMFHDSIRLQKSLL